MLLSVLDGGPLWSSKIGSSWSWLVIVKAELCSLESRLGELEIEENIGVRLRRPCALTTERYVCMEGSEAYLTYVLEKCLVPS